MITKMKSKFKLVKSYTSLLRQLNTLEVKYEVLENRYKDALLRIDQLERKVKKEHEKQTSNN